MERDIPGIDEQGFVPLMTLRQAGQSLALAEFVTRYPLPGLLVSPVDHSGSSEESQADSVPARHLLTLNAGSAKALRYIDRFGFLAKRPGNPFPRMISLGRAGNSDLVVAVDSVSKFHGYFEKTEEGWFFTDEASTNGTTANGKRLESNKKARLEDGDVLLLGLEVQAVFLFPKSLYHRLRGS